MRSRLIVVCALFLLTLETEAQLRPQDLAAGKQRIRALITSQIGTRTAALTPSMVIAVVKDNGIVWEEAFGWADQQRRVAATTTTPYYLASVTKVLTSTAVAILANEGRIDMNRSVNAYLGSYKLRPALWDENAITVERVANQTSGLTTFDISCASAAPCRLESAIDRFGVIIRPPGQTFDYSNLNYGILSGVITHASKQTYGEYLRNAIFKPLGMRDCGIGPDNLPSRAAIRYQIGTTRSAELRYSASVGASGAFCSAHSLALFAQALMNQNPAPGVRQWSALLPSMGVDTGPGQPTGQMYSHGWWITPDYVGTLLIEANGGTSDATALLRIIPAERIALIVLVNSAADVSKVADAIIDEFAPAIRERRKNWTPAAPVARQRRPTSPEVVGTWVGAIDTYRGKRPLTISIDAAGAVTGSLAGITAEINLTNGVASGSRVFGLLANADLGIDESKGGSYDVQLSLALYGSRLAGSASTRAHTGTLSNPVTFLTELTRR